jgi:hypothetical protein
MESRHEPRTMFGHPGGLPKLPTFQPVAPRRQHELHSGTAHGVGKMINFAPMVCKTRGPPIWLRVKVNKQWRYAASTTFGYKTKGVFNQLRCVEMFVGDGPVS